MSVDILLFTTRLCLIACRHLVPYYYSKEYVKASDIAQLYKFNIRSLSPSFTALTKVGILTSRKGGREIGFIFDRDPKDITLYDIVSALEGEIKVKRCSGDIECVVKDCRGCGIYKELQAVADARRKILSSTTMYDQYEKTKKLIYEKSNINNSITTQLGYGSRSRG